MSGTNRDEGATDTRTSRRQLLQAPGGQPAARHGVSEPAARAGSEVSSANSRVARRKRSAAFGHPLSRLRPRHGLHVARRHRSSRGAGLRRAAARRRTTSTAISIAQLGGQMIESVATKRSTSGISSRLFMRTICPSTGRTLHLSVDDFETRRANREAVHAPSAQAEALGRGRAEARYVDDAVWTPMGHAALLCPVAALEAYHTEGESGAARAAKAKGILQIQSNQSSQSSRTSCRPEGEPHWFQLYAIADWNMNKRLLDRVSKAGCPVLVWTVDLLGGSNRELSRRSLGREDADRPLCQNCHNHQPNYQRPMRRGIDGPSGPRPPFDATYIKRLKDAAPWKVVVKGIMTREEAEEAVEAGADAIFVSNHGGRAENGLRGTIDALPEVVAGVRNRVPVMIDSGVRRGADMFKAIALRRQRGGHRPST